MRRFFTLGLSGLAIVMISMIVVAQEAATPPAEDAAPAEQTGATVLSWSGDAPATVKHRAIYVRGPQWEARTADPETVELMERDGELGDEVAELIAPIKGLTDKVERADAEQKLAALVAEQFEIRQSLREKELAELEDQLKRLRELHQQRADQRDRIIADRVQQLVREAEGLGWGDASETFGGVGKFRFHTGDSPLMIAAPTEVRVKQDRYISDDAAPEADSAGETPVPTR